MSLFFIFYRAHVDVSCVYLGKYIIHKSDEVPVKQARIGTV